MTKYIIKEEIAHYLRYGRLWQRVLDRYEDLRISDVKELNTFFSRMYDFEKYKWITSETMAETFCVIKMKVPIFFKEGTVPRNLSTYSLSYSLMDFLIRNSMDINDLPSVIKRNFCGFRIEEVRIGSFVYTHDEWKYELRQRQPEHEILSFKEIVKYYKESGQFREDVEYANFEPEGFHSLEVRTMEFIESYWYITENFKIELLKLDNVKVVLHEKDWYPFLIVFNVESPLHSKKYFAFIGYCPDNRVNADTIIPVKPSFYQLFVKDVSREFETRLVKHTSETDVRTLQIDFKAEFLYPGDEALYSIQFNRFIFLKPCKKDKRVDLDKIRILPICCRNSYINFENQYFRVIKTRQTVNLDAVHFNCMRPFLPDDVVTDQEREASKNLRVTNIQYFTPIIKHGRPVIYFIYDVETRIGRDGEHKVYMICCEYFMYDISDFDKTNYEIEKKSFISNPFIADADEGQTDVIQQFLKFIVRVVNEDLYSHPIEYWKSFLINSPDSNLGQWQRNDSKFFLTLRIVGYNSSNYDDKFLIPQICEVFKPHKRDFSKRGQTINKHVITDCESFGSLKEFINVSFVDIMRFLPEQNSLSNVCSSLEIPLPKINFNTVKFNNDLKEFKIDRYVDMKILMQYFGFEVHSHRWDNKILTPAQKSILKNKFNEIFKESKFTFPTEIYESKFDLVEIIEYYCQRDVTATRLITHLIVFRFRQVLINIFSTKIEGHENTFYDLIRGHYKQSISVSSVPEETDENYDEDEIPVKFTKRELHKPKLEHSSYVDIMEYMSIAQISYTFLKIINISNDFNRLNPKNVPLIKFIRTAYFGGKVDIGFVGLCENKNFEMLDVKSEYPLAMTGPLPIVNDIFEYRILTSEDEHIFIQEKIDNCLFFRNASFSQKQLHLFKPHEYINFLGVLLCRCEPPKSTQASIFSPLPFPEFISDGVRACRYFTVPQTRVLTSHHICALIFQGWKVTIEECDYNIIFNCAKSKCKKSLKHKIVKENCLNLVHNDEYDFCYFKQFVELFGDAKSKAADDGNKVDKKLYKMILNAAAGRLGMKDVSKMTNVSFEKMMHDNLVYHQNSNLSVTTFGKSNYEIAVFINSAALYIITRAQYLLQLKDIYPDNIPLHSRISSVVYTDTDSVLFSRDDVLDEIYNSFVISNDVGKWENDKFNDTWSVKYNCNAVIILAKKSYFLLNKDEKGYKDVTIHSKGFPLCEVKKMFYEDDYLKMDLFKALLESDNVEIKYNGIIKKIVPEDLSQKTFINWEYKKQLNVVKCGPNTSIYPIATYKFLPEIKSGKELLTFTHSPCCYLDCEACRQWYFKIRQSLENYNYKFDRLI
jgi:hypothetical protein